MRDSFIFHFEYLEDIPEELQAQYAMQIINYARYGDEPTFNDWRDQRMWNRIKERMDEETTKYEKRCRNLRHQDAEPQKLEDHDMDALQYMAYTNGDPEPAPKKTRKVFQKPTVEEIAAYCQERGNTVDAQHFHDFYESKGWMIGKNKMKDWKASVRYWETTQKKTEAPRKQLPQDRIEL